MTLTKAELADILVDKVSNVTKNDAKEIVELFLKKSAALWHAAKKSKFPVSVIFSCATNRNAPAVIRKPAKKYRLPPAA